MNVLSLFNGASCFNLAADKSGLKLDNVYTSEIDPYCLAVEEYRYPNNIKIGDVKDIKGENLPQIDLLVGGSPCQGFSFAGKQLNFGDPRSILFFEYIRLLKEVNPKYFLLENVVMKKEYQDIISNLLGVEPIKINSALVSAQNRERLYWTNILSVAQPEDNKTMLKNILEDLPDDEIGIRVREKSKCVRVGGRNSPFGSKQEWDSPFQRLSKKCNVKKGIKKASCLTGGAHSGGNHSDMDIIHTPYATRRYSVVECERLQTMPDNYTLVPYRKRMMSNSQRYKMIGNGWTIDVIAHILKGIKE